MEETYTVTLTVKDNQTGDVLMTAELSIANRSDVFETGEATPSTAQAARFLLKSEGYKVDA
jgi:PKD repeat protein